MTYNSYPLEIKHIVATTKDLKIARSFSVPRKTAKYWMEKGIDKKVEISPQASVLLNRVKELQKELDKEKKLRNLLEKIKRIAPLNNEVEKVINPDKRKKVIDEIKKATEYAPLSECLKIIGLTKSTYYRWTSEFAPKIGKFGSFIRKSVNQLTDKEIFKLRKFLTCKQFLHFPIASLHYYMLRTKELICSMQTWYRYVKLLGITRWNHIKKEKPRYEETGIRASSPNEIWHIDVTQIKLWGGKKAYLQVVVDNYSRYVLAWKITENIGATFTLKTLKDAKKKALQLSKKGIVMDGGTENRNAKVKKYIVSNNCERLLAGVDIESSNSLIEALFRSLKNNYLYHHRIKSVSQLKYRVKFYFNQHNEVIPHSAFGGATPLDIYENKWSDEEKIELRSLIKRRSIDRRFENKNTDLGANLALIA